jgi:hypothetical protein
VPENSESAVSEEGKQQLIQSETAPADSSLVPSNEMVASAIDLAPLSTDTPPNIDISAVADLPNTVAIGPSDASQPPESSPRDLLLASSVQANDLPSSGAKLASLLTRKSDLQSQHSESLHQLRAISLQVSYRVLLESTSLLRPSLQLDPISLADHTYSGS